MKIRETITAPLLTLAVFLLLLFSRVIDMNALSETDNVYLVIVVLQLMIFTLPTLVYCKLKGRGYYSGLRLALPRAETMFTVFVAAVVLISGEMLIRIVMGSFTSLSDGFSLYGTYTATGAGDSGRALYLIFAFALIPAVCEELLFRSVLIREYESCGVVTATLATSLLFTALHFNFERAPVYLFSGIVLAMTLYATRSTLSCVIVHFIYNIFGLFGQKYMSAFYKSTGSAELFVFLVALVFLVFLTLFFSEVSKLYASHSQKNRDSSYVLSKKAKRGKAAEALLSPPFLVCILLFVIVTVGTNS